MVVFPGDFLAHGEEAEGGVNTVEEEDDIYAAVMGEVVKKGRVVSVMSKKHICMPRRGLEVYGIVVSHSPSKAILYCIPACVVSGKGRGVGFMAALEPRGMGRFVKDMRYEARIGDIIFGQVVVATREGNVISISAPKYGFVAVFCPKCRQRMVRKGNVFVCKCGNIERRKIARR